MTQASELLTGTNTTMSAALGAGIKTLSRDETVVFTSYTKTTLTKDGFVFWLNAEAPTMTVQGSLHYSVDQIQAEDETFGKNRVVFSTQTKIQEFDALTPGTLWVGALPNGEKFAFSEHGKLYQAAGLYHYVGDALYPALSTQIVDNPVGFDTTSLVVSDSLPAWLAIPSYVPPYSPNPDAVTLPLFPSFLVPDNILPPYGVVHIDGTTPLQAAPWRDSTNGHWQLVSDRVRVTIYGLRNMEALQFLDLVSRYSQETEAFGISNIPVVTDEKRTQSEMTVIAQKKTIMFDVNYYQSYINTIAQQYILSVSPSYVITDLTGASPSFFY